MKNWSLSLRLTFSATVGILVGAAFGLAKHLIDGSPLGVSLAVFIPALGMIVAPVLYMFAWPTAKMRAEQRRAEHSVENRWGQEAAATAFFTLATLLIWVDIIGSALAISWLSPITLWHVVACAALAYGLSYLIVRLRESR